MKSASEKHMLSTRNVAALILCLCMIFTMFPVTAFAADIPTYDTLDQVPENVDAFRTIRTGSISGQWINGNYYYQFSRSQEKYPVIRIKSTAFTTAPQNNYLKNDNAALSQNCKNEAERVCYYTKQDWWTRANLDTPQLNSALDRTTPGYSTVWVVTTSMYRLELKADANFTNQMAVTAKLTSGVTFDYDTSKGPQYALTRRSSPIALRPNVSVAVTDNAQNVQLKEYQITEGFGSYSDVSDGEKAVIATSGLACLAGIAGTVMTSGSSAVISGAETLASCTAFIVSTVEYSNEKGYHSTRSYAYQPTVTFPLKLASSDNYVKAVYTLNCAYDKSATNFLVAFSFN